MIYLIRNSSIKTPVSILKIGFTDSLDKRMSQYYHNNPGTTLLSIREGSELEETKIHLYLTHKGYKYKNLNEWFLDISEVLGDFHKSIPEIDSYLWKHRKEILGNKLYPNLKKSMVYEVYKSLTSFSTLSADIVDEVDFMFYFKLIPENGINLDEFTWDNRDILLRNLSFSDNQIEKLYKSLFDKYFNSSSISEIDSKYIKHINQGNDFISTKTGIKEIDEFFDIFQNIGIFTEKMKLYCEFRDIYSDNKEIIDVLNHKILDSKYQQYYEYYGTSKCRAVGYREKDLYIGFKNISREDELMKIIYSFFKSGDRFTKVFLKQKLQEIYDSLGISRKAKASDLGRYFKLTKTNITDPVTKKLESGFKLGEKL